MNKSSSGNDATPTRQPLIQPRTLKGFRDYLPETMIPRERLMETARQVYRSYGFSPIDTPALEYLEILSGKGGEESDRQLYHFQDHGGREVGLRFDLTVPLARFAAQHIGSLGTPFKRYHIASVWRGENTQRGRYREFMQCDFDTIGTHSVVADIETGLVIHDLMQALGFTQFTIRINNRAILNGLLEKLDLASQATLILRALDKLPKIGAEKVIQEMTTVAGASASQATEVLRLTELEGSNEEILDQIQPLMSGNETGQEGLSRLAEVVRGIRAAGIHDDRIALDVSIARGLDYYTGVIYETFLDDLPGIGSVCSGGRYDNLAELYTRQELPGIGASLGLDRLLAAMQELNLLQKVRTPAEVFIAYFDSERLDFYLQLASWLRAAGINTVVHPESKRLGQQLKYADQQGFQLAIVAGETEIEGNYCQLKNLASGNSQELSLENQASELVAGIKQQLADH
jgi:histidyl-tRNA synthetase